MAKKHWLDKHWDLTHSKGKEYEAKKKSLTLKKGRGRDGSMEHKATGIHNTRKLFD
jgi:hypothetical protein